MLDSGTLLVRPLRGTSVRVVNGEQDKVFVKDVLSLSPSLYSFKFHFWGERGLIRLRLSISRRKTWYPNIFQFFFGFRTLSKTSTFTDICCCNCLLTILDLKTSWKLLSTKSTENHYSNLLQFKFLNTILKSTTAVLTLPSFIACYGFRYLTCTTKTLNISNLYAFIRPRYDKLKLVLNYKQYIKYSVHWNLQIIIINRLIKNL